MYKRTIGIEAQLRKIANENPEYGALWSTWNLNKKTLEPILNAIIKDYPHYSFHEHSHSESILLNIERLLGNENVEKLSPTDLWSLLHVAYLHDFGMVIIDTKIHDFWSTDNFQDFLAEQAESDDEDIKKAAKVILGGNRTKEQYSKLWPLDVKSAVTLLVSKYCRGQHADYSKDYIMDISNVWGIDLGHNGLIKKRLVNLLAEMSAIHTKPFEDIFKLHKEANGFQNDYIHPRLIACLIRLGDVLDLDNGRFNLYGETIFGEMPKDSKTHLGKHEATKHVLITDELIEVEADCPTDEIYRETRKWYDLLKCEMDNLHLNWSCIAPNGFNYPPKLAPYKILRDGVEDANELSSLKFTISQNKAFEILEGAAIYKDKFSCIREIVQNAEDATKIQLWRDIQSGVYYCDRGIEQTKVESGKLLPSDIPDWIYKIYSIEIKIEKNEQNNAVVSVSDRGTGISLATLKAICNVGQSYFQEKERKQEIESMPDWLKPTANFGIGLQSCFMITDKITIYTNSNKDGMYKLTFQSGKQDGYVNVESCKNFNMRGSRVELEISNDLNFSYDVWGFAAKNIMRAEPFETNCIIIYKVIETIFKECDSSFFDISVISESAKLQEKIPAYISEEGAFPNLKMDGKELLYVLSEDKATLSCWYHNNFYKVTLVKNCCRGMLEVKFKGKDVKKTKIPPFSYRGFRVEVDIYGLSTKESLSLNREELNYTASSEISKDLNYIIDIYFEFLEKNAEYIKDNVQLVDAYMLTSWYYEHEFPQSLHDSVSSEGDVRILSLDEEGKNYQAKNCNLSDLLEQYPKYPYINRDITVNSVMGGETVTEKRIIEILNESHLDKAQTPKILIDYNVKTYLYSVPHNITYLDGENKFGICKAIVGDELHSPDEHTRKLLIRQLVYTEIPGVHMSASYIMRRAIPAFEEFSKLAVELKDIYFVGWDEPCKWKIISPISLDDSAKIRELSKEAFAEYIINRNSFANLINYVMEHGKNKCSREEIIQEYKRLIEIYYDIAVTPEDVSE